MLWNRNFAIESHHEQRAGGVCVLEKEWEWESTTGNHFRENSNQIEIHLMDSSHSLFDHILKFLFYRGKNAASRHGNKCVSRRKIKGCVRKPICLSNFTLDWHGLLIEYDQMPQMSLTHFANEQTKVSHRTGKKLDAPHTHNVHEYIPEK